MYPYVPYMKLFDLKEGSRRVPQVRGIGLRGLCTTRKGILGIGFLRIQFTPNKASGRNRPCTIFENRQSHFASCLSEILLPQQRVQKALKLPKKGDNRALGAIVVL